MPEFIAMSIENAENKNGTGQAKYTAYLIKNARLYGQFRADVDSILTVDGYEQCIVA